MTCSHNAAIPFLWGNLPLRSVVPRCVRAGGARLSRATPHRGEKGRKRANGKIEKRKCARREAGSAKREARWREARGGKREAGRARREAGSGKRQARKG